MSKPVSSQRSLGTHHGAENQLETPSNDDTIKEININKIENIL